MTKKISIISIAFIIIVLITITIWMFAEDLSPKSQNAATAASQELKDIGLYDVTTYGADKTGVKDSTIAIQAAMDAAFREDAVTFFPPGTYRISKTLKGLKDRAGIIGQNYHMMGSTDGDKLPTIILTAGSFTDKKATNDNSFQNGIKKAMVHYWACDFNERATTGKTLCEPDYTTQLNDVNSTNGNTAMLIGNSIQNLNFVIEANNPDAVAIRITGNQKNALSNITIDVGSGFAGILGSIGTNSLSQGITINGGKYGIYGLYGGWGAYTNIKLTNQQILAFTSHKGPGISLNGFEIIKDTAPAIGEVQGQKYTENNSYQSGTVALVDGVITFRNNSTTNAAIKSPSGKQISVVNVFVYKASKLIQTEDGYREGNPSGWNRIGIYANTVSKVGEKLIDGVSSTQDYDTPISDTNADVSIMPILDPDGPRFRLSHGLAEPIPSPDKLLRLSKIAGSGVVDVRNLGITPQTNPLSSTSPDYSAKLNQIFANTSYKYVLFPKGVYPIKNTLNLSAHTKLVGIVPKVTEIKVHPDWKPGGRVDMVRTVDSASATTMISGMALTVNAAKGNNFFDTIHWRAGKDSVIYYAYADTYGALGLSSCKLPAQRYGNERNDYHISGNGGGRIWGTGSGGGGCSKFHEKYRGLLVENTVQPLVIYGFNPEDGHGETISETEGFQSEIRNSSNVSIRSHKSEDSNSLLIRNSSNIFIVNPGGSIDWTIRDSNDFLILNTVSKFVNWTNKDTGVTSVKEMIREESGGNLVKSYNTDKAISALSRGKVYPGAWLRKLDSTGQKP